MSNINSQIEFITELRKQLARITDHHLFNDVLNSLARIKVQDDLDDQQADDHASGKYQRGQLALSCDTPSQTELLLEAQAKEISEIKYLTEQIASRFSILPLIDYDHRPAKEAIETLKAQAKEQGFSISPELDPAVKLLLGDDIDHCQYEDLAKVNVELDHDIAILIDTRSRAMTHKELTDELAQMYYKTPDLDLLKAAKKYVTSQLPF